MKTFIENDLKTMIGNEFDVIHIPDDLSKRCLMGVRKAELEMKKNKKKQWIRRMTTAAAAFVVCVLVFTQTTAADTVKGFFKDITRVDGAITGTAYEVGMDEIQIQCQGMEVHSEKITMNLQISFANAEQPPYSELAALQIGEGQILNEDGKIVYEIESEADMLQASDLESGSVCIGLDVDDSVFEKGQEYVLVIDTLYGHKKADAPLVIQGEWSIKLPSLTV